MNTLFTDLELLNAIHEDSIQWIKDNATSTTEDITTITHITLEYDKIASKLKSHETIIKGRLSSINNSYNHKIFIENKNIPQFSKIDFSSLCSVLAYLQNENQRVENTFNVACFSLFFAIIALFL